MVKKVTRSKQVLQAPKSADERQAARRAKIKADKNKYEEYLESQKSIMRLKRSILTEEAKEATKKKESSRRKELRRLRKERKTQLSLNAVLQNAQSPVTYSAKSTLMKAVKRVDSCLPKSPNKKRAVVKHLACKVKLTFPKKQRKLNEDKRKCSIEIEEMVKEFYSIDVKSMFYQRMNQGRKSNCKRGTCK